MLYFGPLTLMALGAMMVTIGACSDAPTAERVLRQNGYTEIKTTGHSWFGCSKDDSFATSFEAKGPTGVRATGAVCSGWLKGGSVRLD